MKQSIRLIVLALFVFLLASAAAPLQTGPPALAFSELEPAECPVEVPPGFVVGEDVLCYFLRVPARYDNPQGATIRLAVMVLRATDPLRQPDPLFFAQGGPGGSTIDLYTSYLFSAPRLHKDRDIVLLEQRGTLYSEPALYCTEYDDFTMKYLDVILPEDEAERLSQQALSECLTRLQQQGVDMADFNSFENARDIETLRLALKYDQINLYGVSYGTLLAQHYMRLFPNSLRSVILDGVVPTESNLYEDVLRNEDRAFRYFFEACQADPECSRSYPDLEEVFYQTVDALDQTPASLTLYDLDTATEHAAIVDGASLYGSVFQMLYDATLSRLLPRIIYDAKNGDFTILSKVLSLLVFDRTMSYGMYYSVMCAEDGDFDPASIDTSGIRPEVVEFNEGNSESILQTCRTWGVPALPAEANQPVFSDVPTLLLSGGFDPVTPSSNADRVAANLSQSYRITFPWGAHGQLFSNACADQIVQDFWDNPTAAPDTACMAEYQTPNFFSPNDILMLPVTFKLLRLDASLLPGTLLFSAGFLGLLSAWFFFPLTWLINLFRKPAPAAVKPAFSLRLATPLALLNGIILIAFLAAYVIAIVSSLDGDSQFLLFFGLPGIYRPIFILPLFSLLLTLGMAALSLQGWFSEAWHVLRKTYYSLITFSAILVLLVLGLAGLLFGLFS
ncbi:MAG: alpha/beta fold hydrolase [Anaerolineales bacterium]|jgi:pimeloyl-ACP methyl ester carboxylesterase|nr:alpha/beta fold hydrolase [Anaerolineales bacterium]